PISLTIDDVLREVDGNRSQLDAELLRSRILEDAHAAYDKREQEFGPEVMRMIEREVLLRVIDQKWREHLYEMDYLKEGVGLRAYGQRNPVVEYQREGFTMFTTMLEGIKEETIRWLFLAEPRSPEAPARQQAGVPLPVGDTPVEVRLRGLGPLARPTALQYTSPTIAGAAGTGGVTVEREQDRTAAPALGLGGAPAGRPPVGGRPAQRGPRPRPAPAAGRRQPAPGQVVGSGPSRHAPRPCGSGKKYKRCHGAPSGSA